MALDDAGARPRLATLGLPLRDARAAWVGAALVFAHFTVTMTRDLSVYDSAELALVGARLGLGHPTGQPLHTLLVALLTRLPGLATLTGAVLASALPGALLVFPIVSLAEWWQTRESSGAHLPAPSLLAVVLASTATPWWEPSTRVEVYALGSLFCIVHVAQLARLAGPGSRPSARALLATGATLGLAASVHPLIAVVHGLGAVALLLEAMHARRLDVRGGLTLVAGGLLGLLPYSWVPLAHLRAPYEFVWGADGDAGALGRYLRGEDYSGNLAYGDATLLLSHLRALAEHALSAGFALPLLAGSVAAVATARGRRGSVAAVLIPPAMALLLAGNTVFDVEVLDYLGYLMGPFALAVAGLAAALASARSRRARVLAATALAAGALVVLATASGPRPWERTRARDALLRTAVTGALTEAPRGSLLLVAADHWVAPLLYVQEVEGRRPDVVVVAAGLASSSWYWRHLRARHPDLPDFLLRGRGGRSGRLRRLLDAVRGRAVLVDSDELARQLGLPPCGVGFLIWTGDACAAGHPDADAATLALEGALAPLGLGSPLADAVGASIGLERGTALARLGRLRAGRRALLAGVPPALRPTDLPPSAQPRARATPGEDEGAPPLLGPLPTWRRPRTLGDPARNLWLAARFSDAAGDGAAAASLTAAAAALGLPEAMQPRTRPRPPPRD
jgi:hypothetical protein